MSTGIQITYEDQLKINNFSKLHHKSKELEAEKQYFKKMVDQIEDCKDDLMEFDDEEEVKIAFSNCFFNIPVSEANDILEKRQEEAKAKMAEKDNLKNGLNVNMEDIKKELKAKLGDSIYLEEK